MRLTRVDRSAAGISILKCIMMRPRVLHLYIGPPLRQSAALLFNNSVIIKALEHLAGVQS